MPARIVRLTIAMLTVAIYSAVFSPTVSAQDNQCVSCHFDRFATSGIPLPAAEEAHLNDWDRSTHAASDVSCDACHGGDPTVTTLVGAHERVLSQTNPASPVHSRNIPETCGGCHAAQFEAFQTSRHHELVTSGVRRAHLPDVSRGGGGQIPVDPGNQQRLCVLSQRGWRRTSRTGSH